MGRTAVGAWLVAAALVVAGDGARTATAGDGTIARSEEFTRRVNGAIDAGIKWLRGAQRKEGHYPDCEFAGGVTALAYHTLRACHVAAGDPHVAAVYRALTQDYDRARPRGRAGRCDFRTYTAALYCMAIADHGETQPAA